MSTVALVLFALQRFHSPGVAGLAVFLLIFPGLVMSPLNGALLDRFGRRRLMVLDLSIAASGVFSISLLAETGALSSGLLLLIVSLVSLTSTLSAAGQRSLFPLIVPTPLWDRVNAVDTLCYGMAAVAGPGFAGLLTAWLGSSLALVFVALGYVVAALALAGVGEPRIEPRGSRGVVRDAWSGLRYVVAHRSLRWLAVSVSLSNIGLGLITVSLPLLVFRLHGSASLVGALFAAQGASGIPSALLAGRLNTMGRERALISGSFVLVGVATAGLTLPAVAWMTLAMLAIGVADGPLNVALFSMRQRRTDRRWFGRAFAISMSLNYAGTPLGAAFAGPLVMQSLTLAVLVAAALSGAAALTALRIPVEHDESARTLVQR